jgi:RimJ/RimL family protein N-acetyltransferase
MSIPLTLVTARLTLRQFVHEDWSAMHEHYSDPECTTYTFRRALTEAKSWRAMARMVGHWQLRGYGPYAVVESKAQIVIGAIGLWYPNDWPEPEIKWALIRKHWGMGYASEAVRAVQRIAVIHFNGKAPISLIDRDNKPSIKLALSVGATFERQIPFRGLVSQLYRHPTMKNGET